MNIFVTGGSGFIGTHLIRQLTKSGHHVGALWRGCGQAPQGCQTITGDLRHLQGLESQLEGYTAIIHCAAAMDPIHDAAQGDLVNRSATLQLARAAKQHGVKKFIFISSIAAIGIRDLPGGVSPATPCQPTTVYGHTKRQAELELLALGDRGPTVTIIRPPTVYGVGERRNFLSLVKAIHSRRFLVPGAGDNPMSFCHVQNLVEAIDFVLHRDCPPILHITDLPPLTLRQVCTAIAEELGIKLLPLPFPRWAAVSTAICLEIAAAMIGRSPPLSRGRLSTLTSRYALNCDELLGLGFKPPLSFQQGLRETVNWYRNMHLL